MSAAIEGTGRALPSHGATEMPLWGGIFRWLDSEGRTRVRIDNLVAYVESLPGLRCDATPAPEPRPLSGAELFQTFCASCHGPNAKGDGVMTGQLRRDPPDLTRLGSVGGAPAPDHRWPRDGRARGSDDAGLGEVFLRRENDRSAANARVAALVAYIMSIQERPAE